MGLLLPDLVKMTVHGVEIQNLRYSCQYKEGQADSYIIT